MSRIVIKSCVMCNEDFEVKFYQRNAIFTCSKECSNRKLTVSKLRGKYLQCDMCDKLVYKMPKKVKRNNFCSYKCDHLYRNTVKQLGSSRKLLAERKKYYGEDWGRITRALREEQEYKCLDCGISEEEYGQNLSVHHIIPFITFDTKEEANKRDNLVGVCEPCHRKRHSGEGHIMKLNPEDVGRNATSKYGGKAKVDIENAKKVVSLLFDTKMSIGQIAVVTGVHRTTVTRIYNGKRWRELYDGATPKEVNPRPKAPNYNKKHN